MPTNKIQKTKMRATMGTSNIDRQINYEELKYVLQYNMIFHIYCNTLTKLTNLKIQHSHSSTHKIHSFISAHRINIPKTWLLTKYTPK